MLRHIIVALACTIGIGACLSESQAQAQQAFGRQWGGAYTKSDWNRMYHYPYVYYPQNFWSSEYYTSRQNMYYRYPPEMQIPVYNRKWHNYYPEGRRYHSGHHFILDTF